MKKENKTKGINVILSLLAVLFSALLGFWVYSVAKGDDNDLMAGIVSFVCFMVVLIPLMGVHYSTSRLGVNIRVLSIIAFIIFIAVNFIYAACGVSVPSYVIVNGILLIIYLAVFYKMNGIDSI